MAATALVSAPPEALPAWLDDATLAAVRPQVRALLEGSPAFRALPRDKQIEMARTMVRVASYMSNPQGLARQEFEQPMLARDGAPARSLADAVDQAKSKASDKIGTFAGADFQAGALRQGTQAFKELVGSVDFPEFVGGLIQNVFQAIVNASIQQMQAYAEMLKSVAQTVDQFAQDNISLNNARDWLVERFPGQLGLDESSTGEEGSSPRIAITGDDEQSVFAALNATLQPQQPFTDISEPEQETRLVTAARLQMARSRQQLLASMVLLGINRIVVTDGAINAKVVFDLKASDQAQREARASLYDSKSSLNQNITTGGVHFGFGAAASANVNEQRHRTTVSSSVDESSESKAEVKAKLSGEVRVNFKSDYLPMEKMATPGMIASIQGNATPFDPNTPLPRTGAGGGAAAQQPRV